MALDYGLLRKIHRLLKQQNDLRDQIRRGPLKIKVVTANEASFLEAKDLAKENATQLRMAADAKQMQLGEREAKIEDLNSRLNTCASNKEFQLLKDRIAADLQANSVLQDEILEQLEKLDTLVDSSESAKANYAKSQSETQKITALVKEDLERLESELDRVTNELADAEKQLPTELQVEYQRLLAGKGEDALGETDTQTCGNCSQTLTTQTVAELMLKNAIFCKGCGCWLYISENNPAGRT